METTKVRGAFTAKGSNPQQKFFAILLISYLYTSYDVTYARNRLTILSMMVSSPFPCLAQLVDDLRDLDAKALAGLAVEDKGSRERLRDWVRRIQARLIAKIIDQTVNDLVEFGSEQGSTVDSMLWLLSQWAMMLEIPLQIEAAVADLQKHANSNNAV